MLQMGKKLRIALADVVRPGHADGLSGPHADQCQQHDHAVVAVPVTRLTAVNDGELPVQRCGASAQLSE